MTSPTLVATGLTVGLPLLPGLVFDPNKPFTGCRICGAVYQSSLDRSLTPASSDSANFIATESRRMWSKDHAKMHSPAEHIQLSNSGRWCTAAAQLKLATVGVVSLGDAVFSEEHMQALMESKPIPQDDVEGAT